MNLFSSDLEVKEVEERYNEKLELAVMDIDIGTIKPPNTVAFGEKISSVQKMAELRVT